MKRMSIKSVLLFSMLFFAKGVYAEMDGSQILMQEAERAKEVQQLQYQTELLKQRAEITRYINQIKENGGDVSDLGINGASPQQASSSSISVSTSSGSKSTDTLPTLIQIEKDRAAFDTDEGRVFGKIGQTLPGGYRIVSLDLRDGVRLQKDGMKYDIDVAW